MENVIDLIATDSSPSDISDAIKNVLYSKATEKIDNLRPNVFKSIFDSEIENENSEDIEDQE